MDNTKPSFILISAEPHGGHEVPEKTEGYLYERHTVSKDNISPYFIHNGQVPRFTQKGLLMITVSFNNDFRFQRAAKAATEFFRQLFKEITRHRTQTMEHFTVFDLFFAAYPSGCELNDAAIAPLETLLDMLNQALRCAQQHYPGATPNHLAIDNHAAIVVFKHDDIGELSTETQEDTHES